MPFSHHSHSGEFCNHAVDQLEDVIQEAIRQGIQTFALTEHMPRSDDADLYPGEADSGWSIPEQKVIYEQFYRRAKTLQHKYKDQIDLLVGIEIDWIRSESETHISNLLRTYQLDLFIGSVHHVHGIPIDFDVTHYQKAVRASAARVDHNIPTEQTLFEDYYNDQYAMLQALKPPIVGHFDLIRLLSPDNKNISWKDHPQIWTQIIRNLQFIKEYGGCLELNGAALRKGLREPYPTLDICQYFCELGGHFVFSDDSHGIAQVGHSYKGLFEHAVKAGIQSLAVFQKTPAGQESEARLPGVSFKLMPLDEVRMCEFWKKIKP